MKTLNKIKSGYEELEIKPSSNLWDRIDRKLDEAPETALKQPFQWWKYSAAAILVMISTGAFIYFNQSNSVKQPNAISIVKSTEIGPKNSIEIIQNDGDIKNTKENLPLSSNSKTDLIISGKKEIKELNSTQKTDVHSNVIKTQNADISVKNPVQITSNDHQLYSPELIIQEEKIVMNNEKLEVNKEEKAEKKSSKYIQANDLLAGREFDKARKENKEKQFGVVDIDKIKGPNSLKILGITVYSESLEK